MNDLVFNSQLNKEVDELYRSLAETIVEQGVEAEIPIEHFVYAGLYVRTCRLPKDSLIVGAMIQIPTVVIVSGNCVVSAGLFTQDIIGNNIVIKGLSNRRQIFLAREDSSITMIFRTDNTDLRECEKEFTPEWKLLTNNRSDLVCQV